MRELLERVCNDPVYFVYRGLGYGAVIFLMWLLVGCATVQEGFVKKDGLNPDGSMSYTLTPEQVAQCAKEGGCSTVTDAYEKELVRQAAKHFCGVDI